MKIFNVKIVLVIFIIFQLASLITIAGSVAIPYPLEGGPMENIRRYNVVWTSPSKNASWTYGAMYLYHAHAAGDKPLDYKYESSQIDNGWCK